MAGVQWFIPNAGHEGIKKNYMQKHILNRISMTTLFRHIHSLKSQVKPWEDIRLRLKYLLTEYTNAVASTKNHKKLKIKQFI